MGQYYYIVNPDKRQYLHPHRLWDGLKLLEFGCNQNSTLLALAVLLADGNGRGGGDLSVSQYNKCKPLDKSKLRPDQRVEWEHKSTIGKTPTYSYGVVSDIVGSWAGDRVVVSGDYADPENYVSRDLMREWCVKKGYPATAVERGSTVTEMQNGKEHKIDFSEVAKRPNLHLIAQNLFEDISEKVLRALCDDKWVKEAIVERASFDSYSPPPRWLGPAVRAYNKKRNRFPGTLNLLHRRRCDQPSNEFRKDLVRTLRALRNPETEKIEGADIEYMLSHLYQDPNEVIAEMLNSEILVDMGNVNWEKLREQKEIVYEMAVSNHTTPSQCEALTGIVHLLDHIQDTAAKKLGGQAVFGDLKEEEVVGG